MVLRSSRHTTVLYLLLFQAQLYQLYQVLIQVVSGSRSLHHWMTTKDRKHFVHVLSILRVIHYQYRSYRWDASANELGDEKEAYRANLPNRLY